MGWSDTKSKSEHDPTAPYRDSTRGERLQRVLAAGGIASRRKCEELIESGVVRVNGVCINFLPAWVDVKQDRITVEDQRFKPHSDDIYVMYYKPRGIVCTMRDPQHRPCVGDIVTHHSGSRIFPIGRLDMDSQGLLLLTNDNMLANELLHPRHGMSKTYEVSVKGKLSEETVARLQKGIYLSDEHTRHDKNKKGRRARIESISIERHDRDKTLLKITLAEGRNRQVRRMLAIVGHPVKRLRRTHIGSLALRGLQPGQWRDLTPKEVTSIKKSIRRQ